ncbi:MAG: mechanosensitive ion channel [Chitinophagales bacterium]|nr:mechanosensitive ion channel [Chitinophagales bacterium]MCZ2392906.1 mechanosensitive ion channel [Chitinophagales bacterium]MCZ2392909.1 mechanosensitive ion channel [Chitinophagales bacterium]
MNHNEVINDTLLELSYWEKISKELYELLITKGIELLLSLLLLFIGFFIIGKIAKAIKIGIYKKTNDIAVSEFIEQSSRIVLKIMLLLTVASQLGVQTTSFVAAIGAAGLAIGMALQGSLANFAGGVLILVFKPFKVGDSITSMGFSGEVISLNILHTRLLTGDNKLVVLPNGQVANNSVVNASNQKRRRAEFSIFVKYSIDISKVRLIILSVLQEDKTIYENPSPTVVVEELRENNIHLLVRFWTDNGKQSEALNMALENIKLKFEEHHIDMSSSQTMIELIQK